VNDFKTRTAAILPLVLLVGVALSQVFIARFAGRLSPDKGGGFGLFSTVDKHSNRSLDVVALGSGGTRDFDAADFKARNKQLIADAKALPSDRLLRRVAKQVLNDLGSTATTIRVVVARRRFNPVAVSAWMEPVAQYEYEPQAK